MSIFCSEVPMENSITEGAFEAAMMIVSSESWAIWKNHKHGTHKIYKRTGNLKPQILQKKDGLQASSPLKALP